MVKNTDSERQAPLLGSCSSLGKSLTFSVPRFAHLLKADDEYLVNACECDNVCVWVWVGVCDGEGGSVSVSV